MSQYMAMVTLLLQLFVCVCVCVCNVLSMYVIYNFDTICYVNKFIHASILSSCIQIKFDIELIQVM
jgi:hypothetical protein